MRQILVVTLLLIASASAADSVNGQTKTEEVSVSVTVSDPAAGATSDVIVEPYLPRTYPRGQAYFFSPSWGIASDDAVPDGVARASASVQLSTRFYGPCSGLGPNDPVVYDWQFELLEATTNMAVLTNRGDQSYDDDGDGLPNGVEAYPDTLDTIAGGVPPRVRLWGVDTQPGFSYPFAMHVFMFEPGAEKFPEEFGYASWVIFEELRPGEEQLWVTNACFRAASIRHYGRGPAGIPLLTNPASGIYNFALFDSYDLTSEGPTCAYDQVTIGSGGPVPVLPRPDCTVAPPSPTPVTTPQSTIAPATPAALPETGGDPAPPTAMWRYIPIVAGFSGLGIWAAIHIFGRRKIPGP